MKKKQFFVALTLGLMVWLIAQYLLTEMKMWTIQSYGMIFWIDIPFHFLGGVAVSMMVISFINRKLEDFDRWLILPIVFLSAFFWEMKEIVEGVVDEERNFNHLIGGLDFYTFNIFKDTGMALLGAFLVWKKEIELTAVDPSSA